MKLKALSLKKKSLMGKIIVIIIILVIVTIIIWIILYIIRFLMLKSLMTDYDLKQDALKSSLEPYGYENSIISVIGDIQAIMKYREEHEKTDTGTEI